MGSNGNVIGRQLGDYTIEAELGSGGMATVYRAAGPGGTVALKVIHPHLLATPGFFKRFLREAEIGQRVEHANVVRTLDCDQLVVDGTARAYLVMEYVEGQTLRDLLVELECVPEKLCRHIAREVAHGLGAIHAAGAVHRDLKPENLLITPDHVVKIMDLGVALVRDEAHRLSRSGEFIGTLQYAAPEQLRSEAAGRAADYYALGLILYELATGRFPFAGENVVAIVKERLENVPRPASELNPQLSPFFETVVGALLERDPAQRLDFIPDGEESTWWKIRAREIRTATRRPLRRIRIPRETSLYGRDDDLARLRRLYDLAAAGQGQVVLIEGEAGIGKTRLADELIGRLRGEGADLNFLFGGYPPGGAATPAGAWSTAYLEHFGTDDLAALLARYLTVTPALAPAFAALLRGEPTPEGSVPLTQDSLQAVFIHATRALAAERPTVVLIEDLHFAPEEGRAILAALALAVTEHPVLLVGTARPPLPDDWVSNLDRLEHVHHLELERLGPKDLGRLLVDAFQSERLAQELALELATKSDGNPFFVFEIIRGLREGRLIARRPDGTWHSTRVIRDIEIPSTVRELVQARISGLDDADRELLDVAACCGFEFDPLLAGEVLGLPDIPLLRRLGRLENPHRIVRSAGERFVFDHHQVQEALYDAQSALLRRRYHAAIGAALERRSDAAARDPADLDGALAVGLCSHFLSGDRAAKARRYLDAALDHLGRCYLNEQAVALADRALEIEGLLAGTDRAAILVRKAARLDLLGRRDAQDAALAEAVVLADEDGDARLRGETHRALGWCRLLQSRYEDARAECELARDLCRGIGDRHGEGLATGSLGTIFFSVGRYGEARECFERHLSISRELGDRLSEAKSSGNLGLVFRDLGRPEEAETYCRRHLAISCEIGYRLGEANATGNLGILLWSVGRSEEARALYERQLAIAREVGDRRGEATGNGNLGLLVKDLGRFAEAREHLEAHVAISREIGDRRGGAIARVNLGGLLAQMGALDEAERSLAKALATCRAIGARHPEGYALHGLGEVAEAAGDAERAIRLHEEALALRQEIDYRPGVEASRLALGRVLVEHGGIEAGTAHLEEALALGRELDSPETIVVASALLARARGTDPGPAVAAFATHAERMRPTARIQACLLLWEIARDPARLEEARRLVAQLRERTPENYRASLDGLPLHRTIERAWEDRGRTA